MLTDVPQTWLSSLAPQQYFYFAMGSTLIIFVLLFINVIIAGFSEDLRLLWATPLIFTVGLVLFCDKSIENWRYDRHEAVDDLKAHHFIIPQNTAISTFNLNNENDELPAFSIEGDDKKLRDISGDVKLLSTTKDYHYTIYFTVEGQNDSHGKALIWRTSTTSLLRRYGAILRYDNSIKKKKNDATSSFENSHKIN